MTFNTLDYVIIDVETTGMNPKEGHAIVELAAMRVRDRKTIEVFDNIVNPGREIDAEAAAINGISNEMIKQQGKLLIEVIPAFAMFVGESILVGHNIGFDLAFINSDLKQFGLPELANECIDTIALAKSKVAVAS